MPEIQIKTSAILLNYWRKQMRNTVTASLAALLLLAGIAVASSARAADDPSNGTWKLNLAKSKFSPGPALKSSTATIKIENGIETYSADSVDAAGNAIHGAFTVKVDGIADAPLTGVPYADSISVKQINSTHLVAKLKKGGKLMVTVHVVVDPEKMIRTVTYSGKNADGKEVHDVLVFDMQM
jgi:hypothetical protein